MGLLDIGPLTEDVPIGKGKKLAVQGLTAEDIFHLINNFEEIRALVEKKTKALTAKKLMDSAPQTIATIIACSTQERENKKAVDTARRLPAAIQLRLITAILALTFPDGVGPFVDELWMLQRTFTVRVESSSTPDPQKQNAGSANASLPTLSAALQMDEASRQRYRPRRASSRAGLN